LFATCFLHTTLLERRKYGPLGWCIPYEFNHSDLVASVTFLQNHLYQLDTHKDHLNWTTIRYMLCEVLYGGRVTDDYDRRLLASYGIAWFDNNLFQPTFSFFPGNALYSLPNCATIQEYRAVIDKLPLVDTPEIFGLHRNADLAYRQAQAHDLLSSMMNIQPRDDLLVAHESKEEQVAKTTDEYLSKVPHEIGARIISKRMLVLRGGPLAALNIFLQQEEERMQRLIAVVRRSLVDVKKALAGTIVTSDETAAMIDALYNSTVPFQWVKLSWSAPSLAIWFQQFVQRAEQLEHWLLTDRPNAFWLTGFFNPQGFFTAVKQEVKRLHPTWPLDAMTLHTQVLQIDHQEVDHAPTDGGVFLYGLILEGASWDRRAGKLRDSPSKILFTEMPVIFVTALHGTGMNVL